MRPIDPVVPQHFERIVPRLIVAASLAIFLTLGASALLYVKINQLLEARNWSEHSLEVQSSLQVLQVRLDRFDALAHLYLLNRLPGVLRETRNLSVAIESDVGHIARLVADNPAQSDGARRLGPCAAALAQTARSLDAPNAALPADAQFSCREIVSLMQERERALAESRGRISESNRVSLLVLGLCLAAFFVLVVVLLFGVLVRDALFRRKAQEDLARSNLQLARSNDELATTIRAMEDRAAEAKLLGQARDQLQMCASTQDAHDITVYFVSRLLPGSSGALCMINNSRQMIELRAAWGGSASVVDAFPLNACCAMRSGQPRWFTPETSALHCDHFAGPPPERYVCLPLIAHGETLGVLFIEYAGDAKGEAIERNLAALRELLQLASMTVASINLRNKLENQSIRDSLTGLFNRHFMELTLERELRRATRRATNMAVLMIDADHFKMFNDTFGHNAGDIVLRAIAERFLASVRSEDVVCRYGGEEFVVILPDITPEKAAERAQQVREAIEQLRVTEHGRKLGSVTVSIGVAMYPGDGGSIEALMQAADRSLYVAKNNGRNQVVFAAQVSGSPFQPNAC
jgi:diguanylate cyclase (GGDEF)-like protein